ncbi:MAG: excinuclease ABC subunit UvrA [Bacteroidales bacterium]|nr:MAG: excinuclease ABC subunit UvrA [Bacteroidales bacterium]
MPEVTVNQGNFIEIKGARVHNLKNINLNIPRDQFIVITGLSGSGKSSLAFDTIYAEGQRRYVESLSSYARQFLGRMNKPEVDYIRGLPPAIAIEQKVNTRNPRSTVGTSTEIYDYLKLLYARIGETFSPVSNKVVKRHQVTDVVDFLNRFKEKTRAYILAPLRAYRECTIPQHLEYMLKQGVSRVELNGEIKKISDVLEQPEELAELTEILVVIDRIEIKYDADSQGRFSDSVQTAFGIGKGYCTVRVFEGESILSESFSNKFEADGILFEEPSVHMFSFNNPVGACPLCEGYGKIIGIDEDLVIPNKALSVYEDAIVCWKGAKMRKWKDRLILHADKFDFPVHKPYHDLSEEQKLLLWTGNRYFKGLNTFFDYLEEKKYKIQYRVMLSRYRGKTVCPECKGARLRREASYVRIGGKSILDLVRLPVDKLYQFFDNLKLKPYEEEVANRLLVEIRNRLLFLVNVGLSYLTLNRLSNTLSGGESQRINLATALGSSLVGSLYILDEPSIGLHPRDTTLLIRVLKHLKQHGNTVMVVEHDEEIIHAADELIDIGPFAGRHGGEIVFQGKHRDLLGIKESITSMYLTGKRAIPVPEIRRKWNCVVEVIGARENNLKGINVKIPLNIMTVITGVSGSGKSSLIRGILYPALNKLYNGYGEKTGHFDRLAGDLDVISNIEFVDQNPIGKSSRSNPVTYLKAYDEIRRLYAEQPLSHYNNYKPSHFSFNVDGGRCEECLGEGVIRVEMQFMADVELVCEACKGRKFKTEILDVRYRGKNIYDILELTVDEAIEFFNSAKENNVKKIAEKMRPLTDVGLGYIKLGQSSSTLSGGESQRVKLASFLGRENSQPKLFIFDEPTTGLHFHDIRKLLDAFYALIENGHSILIVEHNMEIIKSADWIIDLGPEGGENGGMIVFEGTPEDLIGCNDSYTGKFLRDKLNP